MIPVDKLKAAGVNIAGAIHEDFLNEFAAAHFVHNPSVYTGHTFVDQFEDLIRIDYTFATPARFDLDPIRPSLFATIWKKHLRVKGANEGILERDGITPGNVSLRADSVKFLVTVYEGHNQSTIRFQVDFDWALRARAAVYLKDAGGGARAIRLEPVKVAFERPPSKISKEVSRALARFRDKVAMMDTSHKQGAFHPGDEDWCIKVERLILLLLNGVLSTQISNFIREWELPRAIELVDGVLLQPDFLLIEQDELIVGGQVTSSPTGPSPLQSEIDALISDFARRYVAEFESITEAEFEKWNPESSPTAKWLEQRTANLVSAARTEISLPVDSPRNATPTVQLLTDGVLVDILAKKYLSANNGWEGSIEIDRLVKGTVGWWFRVEGARGWIVPGGVAVSSNISIGGKIQVCHFDFDPKNFGGWQCYGPCVNLSPDPNFGISAFPSFKQTGVYLSALLTTRGIAVTFCDWPSWANQILAWATSMLTRPLLDAIRAIILLFQIRIAKYPKHFPGTGLEWTPNMITKPTNLGDYLVFQAAPKFV
jgi:hypothetical protein